MGSRWSTHLFVVKIRTRNRVHPILPQKYFISRSGYLQVTFGGLDSGLNLTSILPPMLVHPITRPNYHDEQARRPLGPHGTSKTLTLHAGWRSNKFSVAGHRNNVVRARTLRQPPCFWRPRSALQGDPPAPAADKIFKNENEWFSVEK